jgi:hypothetical protein
VRLDDLSDNEKPETHAGFVFERTGPLEALEDPRLVLLQNPGALIANP